MRKQRVKMLSAEQEAELLKAYKERKDLTARNKLIESYMPHATRLAEEFARRGTASLSDLVQEAAIALTNAVDNFDPDKGVRISTLSAYYIRAALMRHAMDFHSVVRTGTNLPDKKVFMNLRRLVSERQAQTGGRPLTDEDRQKFASLLGVKPEVIVRMEPRIFSSDVAISATDSVDDGEGIFLSHDGIIAVEGEQEQVEQHLDRLRIMEHIWDVVRASYEGRDLEIVSARIQGDMTQSRYNSLVEKYGISVERIRQIQRGALAKIRESLVAEGYAGLDDITI